MKIDKDMTVDELAKCAEILRANALPPGYIYFELTDEFVRGVKSTATYKRIAKREGWNEN